MSAPFRVWVEGEIAPLAIEGAGDTATLDGRAIAREDIPVALAAWVELGPRPRVDLDPLTLPAGQMALLIGRRDARVAPALQPVLDAGVRHWTAAFAAEGVRRNVEVLEGAGGIFRVAPADDAYATVTLAPTTSTDVLRALIALVR